MRSSIAVAALMLVAASAARGQDLPRAEIVFRSEAWVVRRTMDPMTDRPTCTGVAAGSGFRVQLNDSAFYVSERGRGGVKGVTIRYGEEPAFPLRLPTDMEESVAAVIFDGIAFQHLFRVSRLRLVVLTVLETVVTEDVDLHGVAAAHRFITTSPRCRRP